MFKPKLDQTIFFAALVLLLICALPLLLWPRSSFDALDAIKVFIENNFGVVYLWAASGTLAFVIWIAVSRHGRIRLGYSEPQFSTFSWVSMLFCAGVGTGVLYWGTIEWAYYFDSPPLGLQARSMAAAEWASTYGMFHWGITGWSFYVLATLAIGYSYYVRKIHLMRLSASCRPLLGRQADGVAGKALDVSFMVGLLGSSGTSLGLGTPMIAAAMGLLIGIEDTFGFKVLVILSCTVIFATSVYLGLEKGIKRLSNLNTIIALAFLAFILIAGPTVFILKMTTNSLGLMVQNFIRMSTWTDPLTESRFVEDWSIFYWAWWVAVGPFMGIFIAKISAGRTMRQIVWGTLMYGSVGCAVFFAVLGNYALHLELNEIVPVTQMVQEVRAPLAIASVVASLPLGKVMLGLFCVVSVIYMATTFDSTAFTLASCATQELDVREEPARWHRLFWAFSLALLPIGLMGVGGLNSLKTAALISALPLLLVFGLMAWSLVKCLREDEVASVGHVTGMDAN